MTGASDLLVAARRALLTALEGLGSQRDAVVLVGAQAIYMYTGAGDVQIATTTKDSDLAVDPARVADEPLLQDVMKEAGFHRNLQSGQPGEWLDQNGTPVDLLVPETLVSEAGRRGARIPPHDPGATRKVRGLEAAVVDYRVMTIRSLEAGDPRAIEAKVAGPAALLVAKLHKLGERASARDRLVDKDAHDLYRLLVAVRAAEIADGLARLLADRRSAQVTRDALDYLEHLFANADARGSVMAGRVERDVGDPATVAAAVTALAADLLNDAEALRH